MIEIYHTNPYKARDMRALKVRIYPTQDQETFLTAQFGAVRFVYNKGLSLMRHHYNRHKRSLHPLRDIKPLLSLAKNSRRYCWLSSYDSLSLQESCRNLHKAFQGFFKKGRGYPCFKSRHGKQSSYHCGSGISVGSDWIKVPKLKSPLKARIHRDLEREVTSVTISKTKTGKYYASLVLKQFSLPLRPEKVNEKNVVGLDMGLTDFVVSSEGEKVSNPRFLKKSARNLRCKQKALSRKQKGSKRRAKARLLVAKAHEKLCHVRHDFQHKLSRRIIDENQAVIVETLRVKNMLKNRRLAKHIADASWGDFLKKLEYKAEESGKIFEKIDPWFASSKTCSGCGQKIETLLLCVRKWTCQTCGMQHDRDVNAANNIKAQGLLKLKAEGLSVSANGGVRQSIQG